MEILKISSVLPLEPFGEGEEFGQILPADGPVYSDSQSEGCSSDSGKGSSDTITPANSVHDGESLVGTWNCNSFTSYSKSLGSMMPGHAMIYEFEINQSIVGRLIGRYGCFVNKIKMATGANIIVKRHHTSTSLKICAVEGLCSEIEEAIRMIRERFPIKKFPCLSLEQVNHLKPSPPSSPISFLPSNNKLGLIEGVINDVTVSNSLSLDSIFLQQPTHPTFPALARMHQALKTLYEQPTIAPQLSRPFNSGVICVTRLRQNEWFRAEVVALDEEKDEVTARLVDIGGYVNVPINFLRQIRVDFVTIPFQATECRLANVAPIDPEAGWSEEAMECFNRLAQGQVLQAHVVGYGEDNTTLVHLYRMAGDQFTEPSNLMLINDELVQSGHATWIEPVETFPSDEAETSEEEIGQFQCTQEQ